MTRPDPAPDPSPAADSGGSDTPQKQRVHLCDRCGHGMYEMNCKVICPNCGNRFDCSDLNIYFDK